jgi:hypothetical protein
VFAEQLRANKERLREHMRNKQKSLARGRVFNVAVSGVKHHSLKHPNRRQQIQEAQAAAQKALMSQRPTQAAASAKHKIGKKNVCYVRLILDIK